LLALGTPSADWTIGGAVWVTDAFLIEQVETKGGREATQQMCRAALDLIIADDKRDKPRQYYVMQVCLSTRSDWEADLAQWTKANDTKEFRKAYAPYHAERAVEIAAAQRELDARRQAEAEALWGSKSDDADDGGSSSSGSSAGPVSVTLRNSCSSGVKLFYGDNPEFGSGRTDSLSGNSRTSKQLQAGQKVWLVDDRKQGIASATVSSSTREVEVTCSGINLR
jgi:hypothetical protein